MQWHRRQPLLPSIPIPCARPVPCVRPIPCAWKEKLKSRDIQLKKKNTTVFSTSSLPNIHTDKTHHVALAGLELSIDKAGLKAEAILPSSVEVAILLNKINII